MTPEYVLDRLALAAAENCYGSKALCSCSAVTDEWERVELFLLERAKGMGLLIKREALDKVDCK